MTITITHQGAVAVVTLDRAARKNAITMAMRRELFEAFEGLGEDESVRAVILHGAGDDFCAGADVSEMGDTPPGDFLIRMRRLHRIVRAIAGLKKPVVAAVDGVAIGAGWSLALACDLVLATPRARFAFSFGRIGYAPDAGAVWHLTQQIGTMRAKELVYRGHAIDAGHAHDLGLVLDLVPPEALFERALALATELAAMPPLALAMTKTQFGAVAAMTLDQFLEHELPMQPLLGQTADHREGVAALRAKRPPTFTGR